MRLVHLTIGSDPYLCEYVDETLGAGGRSFEITDTPHGRFYHLAYPDLLPGPDIAVVVLTARRLLAPALRADLALTTASLRQLVTAVDYAAYGHLGFPRLDMLITAGILAGDEPELWRLVATGTPNPRIARLLGYSPRTLQRRLPGFYRLLGASSKGHASRLCSRAVLPTPNTSGDAPGASG
ncbi:MAG TPA: hypothetical protein ENK55_05595 [Actinobacteria bacterium]|nr:hypothetical protein [Actinomycetota bacterium]